MKIKRILPFIAAFFLLTGLSWWGEGAKRYLELKGPTGSGQVEIEPLGRSTPRLRNMAVTVHDLEPNALYSVWYTSERGERKAAGVETNTFKTDASGKGRFVTSVYEDVLDDWRYLEVMHHPSGDPKETTGLTSALKGDLVYGTHS